jgi:hypothetical protein
MLRTLVTFSDFLYQRVEPPNQSRLDVFLTLASDSYFESSLQVIHRIIEKAVGKEQVPLYLVNLFAFRLSYSTRIW